MSPVLAVYRLDLDFWEHLCSPFSVLNGVYALVLI